MMIQSHELKNEDGHHKLEKAKKCSFLRASKGCVALLHLNFSPEKSISTSRTVREYIHVVINHLDCGNLFQQP